MVNWIIGTLVCVFLGLIVVKLVRDKKNGGSTCGCGGCKSCPYACDHRMDSKH
ncbi:MAG: FeoB-associated Cys-rich membrane protein [Sphaerochaetaceae bacterium]